MFREPEVAGRKPRGEAVAILLGGEKMLQRYLLYESLREAGRMRAG
jgi:hypothetical protein